MLTRTKVTLTIALLVIGITVPYLIAGLSAAPEHVFGGFLLNPQDGNSYLAKMQQGLAGEWKFHLTYSPPGGEGAYIFLFYLFLGHVARITALSPILVFHIARILAALGLLIVLWHLCTWLARDDERLAFRMFLLASLGSGLGWLAAMLSGYISSDFWVAEAYPFLSMFTNPHFPLGLALILGIFLLVAAHHRKRRFYILPILSLVLAVVQPFGVVVLALPLAGYFILHLKSNRFSDYLAAVAALLPGGLFLIYQYAAITSDPTLQLWNSQNLTPAPLVVDFMISFSPALLLALVGGYQSWKSKNDRGGVLAVWLIAGILLIYLPFNLQRRFITGLYVPIAGLAVMGIALFSQSVLKSRWIWVLTIILSVGTNLLLFVGGLGVGILQSSQFYLSKDEVRVLAWLRTNTPTQSVVLASPEMGLFIPAWSGRNVVYGHPFESIHADVVRDQVLSYLSGALVDTQAGRFVAENQIDYVLVGSREMQYGDPSERYDLVPLFNSGEVRLYGMRP